MPTYEIKLKFPDDVFTLDIDEPTAIYRNDFTHFTNDGKLVLTVGSGRVSQIKLLEEEESASKEVGVPEMLAVIAEVVAEFGPDYVYQRKSGTNTGASCVYVYNGAPDCLAAKVLRKLGVPLADLAAFETKACNIFTGYGISSRALEVLNVAQMQQDRGFSWGLCLEAARTHAERENWV
jgi:hypothetical protein